MNRLNTVNAQTHEKGERESKSDRYTPGNNNEKNKKQKTALVSLST